MKIGECITRDYTSIVAGNGELMPLDKVIVRSANPQESTDYNRIWIVVDPISEYNAIAFKIRGDQKSKTKAIADFIDKNRGKRLFDILEMGLP